MRHVHGSALGVQLLRKVVDLGHVLAAIDTEAAELGLVGAWLFDLEDLDAV